jgi:hypothetical protein
MENYYDDMIYDSSYTPEEVIEIRDAKDSDFPFWAAVVTGMMTWLKSPHGLKFLMQYHPIYYELLRWDEDRQTVAVERGTDGWAVVDGWTIYTANDLDLLPTVAPGTCCVSGQPLHCTKRVNVKAIMKPCYCGNGSRDMFDEDYYSNPAHRTDLCKKWEQENPPQMVFVSYAALDNILAKRDSKTKCERTSCPNTKCSYHIGDWARVRSLTANRINMLTSTRQP